MKKTKEECLLMNGIMGFDLGKNEARIMKAMDDWAKDAVKNLSSNTSLCDSLVAYQKWCYEHPEYDQVTETPKVELYLKATNVA